MRTLLLSVAVLSFVSGEEKADTNALHHLCVPCTQFMKFVKDLNKNHALKLGVKGACSTVLMNPPACNAAVDLGSAYVAWTPAEVMCERILLCKMEGLFGFGHHDEKKTTSPKFSTTLRIPEVHADKLEARNKRQTDSTDVVAQTFYQTLAEVTKALTKNTN